MIKVAKRIVIDKDLIAEIKKRKGINDLATNRDVIR
jgi:hypothetical protein